MKATERILLALLGITIPVWMILNCLYWIVTGEATWFFKKFDQLTDKI